MKLTIFTIPILLTITMLAGCGTENPVCTDSFCLVSRGDVTGEVIEVDESKVLALIGKDATTPGEPIKDSTPERETNTTAFEPVEITGQISWNTISDDWQYSDGSVIYLKKVIIEIETDEGASGANRVLLVHLNKHTIRRDGNFKTYVQLFGQKIIRLTGVVGIGEYTGEIVGAPTKD